jgi:ParB family chromosome partitioning protein
MTRVGIDLSNLFSGAEYSQEVHELEAQVLELQSEIQQLRAKGSPELDAKIQELQGQLAQGGIREVAIAQVLRNPEQPRRTFTEESIQAIAQSLATDGQQEPIILIEQEGDRFLLFDGERRWRGAQRLGWSTLKAVVIPEPELLHRRVLLANLHRENLNALDTAEALVREISQQLAINELEIPRILRTAIRRLERQKQLMILSDLVLVPREQQQTQIEQFDLDPQERVILIILLGLQLNPASVSTNIFPTLGLSDDLKQAIRDHGLGSLHALALQRLSAKNLLDKNPGIQKDVIKRARARLLKQVITNKLSVAKVRKLVAEEISRHTKTPKPHPAQRQVDGLIRTVDKLDMAQLERSHLEKLQQTLSQTLADVEAALRQDAAS